MFAERNFKNFANKFTVWNNYLRMSKKVFAEIENLKQDICFLDIYLLAEKKILNFRIFGYFLLK